MIKYSNTSSLCKHIHQLWISLFVVFSLGCFVTMVKAEDQIQSNPDGFVSASQLLLSKSYKEKQKAIEKISTLNDKRVNELLLQLLDSKLYFITKTKQLVYVTPNQNGLSLRSIIDGKDLGTRPKTQLKKVRTNNKIRSLIKSTLAKLNLNASEPQQRFNAAKDMLSKLSPEIIALYREREKIETDRDVKSLLSLGLAIEDVRSEKGEIFFKAVERLKGSLYPQAKNALQTRLDKTVKNPIKDEAIKAEIRALKAALKRINEKRSLYKFAENVFFGLSLGSVLLLAAIGLAITFGVMGVINMAHGELIMIGAYTTFFIQQLLPNNNEISLLLAIPAAFIVSALFGIAIERGVIRYLYGRPLETLLATFGISLMLQQLVRSTISAQNVIVSTPAWMSGSLQINPIFSITYSRAYIILFSLIVFAALLFILHKTVLGLQIRAVSQNRSMAKAMGVRSSWVDALTFGLGAGIAGIAGVALSQLTNVGPNMGQAYIIDSFMVVVFGGVGNLWGTLVGAFSLGILNKFLEPYAGAVMAKILVLIFIILFIQKKPRGLFPKKGRFAEE